MKKDRNSFFQEYNMNAYNNTPMMPMYPNQVSSQSSFYQGPALDNPMIQPTNNNYTNDLESRISKIERQLNRLETRLSKLEQVLTNYNTTDNIENTYNSNMYML